VAATAASTLSDKPRWEKDIEPLEDTAAWNPGKRLSRSTPERHADLHGIFGNAGRRLIQDIAFRYRAASSRNIGANWPKSMERGPEAPKSLTFLQTSGSESPPNAPDALAGAAARDVREIRLRTRRPARSRYATSVRWTRSCVPIRSLAPRAAASISSSIAKGPKSAVRTGSRFGDDPSRLYLSGNRTR